MSSGGNLAALLALNKQQLLHNGFPIKAIKGLMLLGAPLDLRGMYWSPNLYFYAGWYGTEKFQHANPINYLEKGKRPSILIIHGQKDGLVPYKSMMPFYEKLKQIAPKKYQLITLEKGTHLEAASWTFEDCPFQSQILKWLKEV